MDIIARAEQRREQLKQELARIEQFLATAYELQQDLIGSVRRDDRSDAEKANAPRAARQVRSSTGLGALTVQTAVDAVRERGPMATRDLLPIVLGRGVEVGGKDPVATLSARLSNKGPLKMMGGKWHYQSENPTEDVGDEEATDDPAKDESAASLFTASQGERRDAAALTD